MQEFEEGFKKWGKYLRPFMSDEEYIFRNKWARMFLAKNCPNWESKKFTQEEEDAYYNWDMERTKTRGARILTHITYAEFLRDKEKNV